MMKGKLDNTKSSNNQIKRNILAINLWCIFKLNLNHNQQALPSETDPARTTLSCIMPRLTIQLNLQPLLLIESSNKLTSLLLTSKPLLTNPPPRIYHSNSNNHNRLLPADPIKFHPSIILTPVVLVPIIINTTSAKSKKRAWRR